MASVQPNPSRRVNTEVRRRDWHEFLPLASALFFAAAVYAATLRFSFVYDDQTQILGNAFLRYWRYVPGYFRGKQWHEGFQNAASANYYRPLNFVWLRINYALFGTHAVGWHATAILLHLLATFLIYSVARRLTQRRLVAGLAALFFAVHPVTHEVVAWVSGTTESLSAVFVIGAFLCYLKSRDGDGVGWLIGSFVLCAAGMLSKESAIMFPALVFAHAWIYGGGEPHGEPVSSGRALLRPSKRRDITCLSSWSTLRSACLCCTDSRTLSNRFPRKHSFSRCRPLRFSISSNGCSHSI